MSFREIHEIELSAVCNLACTYCPHPQLKRPKAHMEWPVFQNALAHLKHYVDAGTQGEVSLTGIGEALLHPRWDGAAWLIRQVIGPTRPMVLATNGLALDDAAAKVLRRLGIGVYVSLHRPEAAAPAIETLRRHGVRHQINAGFVESAFDWAGQVDWYVSARPRPCAYLSKRWAVVRQDGAVNACCMDAHSTDPVGHVDDPVGSLAPRRIALCDACHLAPPSAVAAVPPHRTRSQEVACSA